MSRLTSIASLLLFAAGLAAQTPESRAFSKDQLEQVVAPIALYPDNLVTAVLMAATYPLEVVEADRWLDSHKDLKGDALQTALKEEDWDPSIKSVVAVPEVLKRMSLNLDWTRDLGDAFLAQKSEVMDAIQRMRGKANEAGNLKTSEQQNVTVNQDQTIVIEPTSPEIVYVPQYSTEVYGGGWAYPEPYYPYMYPSGWGLLGFGAGVLVGGALWGNANWGWGNGDIDIDVNRYNNFNNRVNHNWQNTNNNRWGHHVDHRKGVGYRDGNVAQRYGGANRVNNRVPGSDRARGRPSQLPANRPGAGGAGQRPGAGAGAGQRPGGGAGAGQRPGGGAGAGQRPGAGSGQRPSGGARPSQQPSRPSGGYSGSQRPRSDRSSSYRGNSSRGRPSGGGGARGGGGGRGGGGRGGGGRGGRR